MTTNTIQTVEIITRGIAGPAGISDGDRGDVTVSSNGTSIVIDSDAVTYDKIQDLVTANRVLGASAAGTIGEVQITNDYISSSASIALSKLATGALPTAITVTSANISDLSIVNDDVNASAAIAGTKISPDFGDQNIVTTGTVNGKVVIAKTDLSVTSNSAGTSALSYENSTGVFTFTPPDLSSYLTSVAGSALTGTSLASGIVSSSLTSVGSLSSLDVTANITVGGTVDGIDIATDVAANTAKVTNATHTGEVTGATALTIADNAVTNSKMADDAIGINELSATGTASSSTYLRGDNTWATVSGGASAFTGLSDTPSSLGTAGQIMTMNSSANALEFTSDLSFSSGNATFAGDISLANNKKLLIGTDGSNAIPLQIYHNGAHSSIQNFKGNLHLAGQNVRVTNANFGETFISCDVSSAVKLYGWGSSSAFFETTANGAKTTGKLEVTGGLSGSGHQNLLELKHPNTTTTSDGPAVLFNGYYDNSDASVSNEWAFAKIAAENKGSGYGANLKFYVHPGDDDQTSSVVEALNISGNGTTANATFAGNVTLGSGTSPALTINASTDSNSTANEAKVEFRYNQSNTNDSIGYIKLVENATNSFDGHLSFGVPYNNSGTPATHDEVLKINFDKTATFAGDVSIGGSINEKIHDETFDAASENIDPAKGTIQRITLSQAGHTIGFTNMTNGESVLLMIEDGSSGTVTTWTGVTWVTGNAPTLATTGYSLIEVWKAKNSADADTVFACHVGDVA
tara:strand:- start:992 stop:3235 length:2244 start_codon:yes stop_codon:yes gene_type:complete